MLKLCLKVADICGVEMYKMDVSIWLVENQGSEWVGCVPWLSPPSDARQAVCVPRR